LQSKIARSNFKTLKSWVRHLGSGRKFCPHDAILLLVGFLRNGVVGSVIITEGTRMVAALLGKNGPLPNCPKPQVRWINDPLKMGNT
jgi:hypothetical protein